MYSIGDDFNTPAMYQDLASSSMNMMPIGGMYGGGMYGGMNPMMGGMYSNLGTTRLRNQPSDDIYVANKNKEKKDTNFMKKAALVLTALVAVGFIGPIGKYVKNAGGITKLIKTGCSNIATKMKNIFKTTP